MLIATETVVREAPVEPCARGTGNQFEGAVKILDRVIEKPLATQNGVPVVESFAVGRVEADRLGIVRQGFLMPKALRWLGYIFAAILIFLVGLYIDFVWW